MDIHHPIGIGGDQHCRHDFHISGEQDELDFMLLKHIEKLPIIGLTTIRLSSKRLWIHEEIIETMLARPFQCQRIFLVADHSRNVCIDLLGFDRIDQRLEI